MKASRLAAAVLPLVAGLLFCGIVARTAWAAQAHSRAGGNPRLVINEVCFLPDTDKPEWVEIENRSGKPVPIANWVLRDGNNLEYRIPSGIPAAPAGALIVVYLDGEAGPADRPADRPPIFDKGKTLVLHSPADIKGNVLGDKGGQCALYNSRGRVECFVAWGFSPGRVIAQATTTGACATLNSAVETRSIGPGPSAQISAGGAIVALPAGESGGGQAYAVARPEHTSPGKANPLPAPTPHLPSDGSKTGADGRITLSCVRGGPNTRYEFQVCSDPECIKPLQGSKSGTCYFRIKPLAKNSSAYWRVRLLGPDGEAGFWSVPLRLVRGYPKK